MLRRPRLWLLLLAALLAAGAALTLHGGLGGGDGWALIAAHEAALHRWVAAAPLAAGAIYCVVYAGCVLLSLPLATPLTVAGGLLFGTVAGAVLAVLAATAGAVLLFLLARGALAPVLARRAGPWLARLRPGLQRDGFAWLLALRLVPAVPFWLLNLAPALLGMRLAPFAAATLLGIIPAAAVLAGVGAGLGGVLATGARPDLSVLRAPSVLLPLAGLAVLSLLPGRVAAHAARLMPETAPANGTAAAIAAPPRRRRLALRLAWLTGAIILMAEAMFFVPSLVRLRGDWFDRRLTEAELAALSAAVAPGGTVDQATRGELLRLADAAAISLDQPGRPPIMLSVGPVLPDARSLDLRREDTLEAAMRTAASLLDGRGGLIAVRAASVLRPGATVSAMLYGNDLHRALVHHARRIGIISLLVAVAAGALLYAVLLVLLVRPMRRLTESIAAFRANPEHSIPLDDATLGSGRDDEITAAARELAAMQRELRAALWRNARLAALGTAVAKVNHDLRGILSPAMLTAERLQMSADPSVKRAGDVLVRAVERAAELTRRTLEFTRDTPTASPRRRMALRPAVEEAAEQVRPACPLVGIANRVPADIEIEADRESLVRVLGNLMRNAGEAEARRITINAERLDGELAITVADDGPGLPEHVRAALFRPFVTGAKRGSTGLGLAIVHDLMRAQGGDAVLIETGPKGTEFRLTLPERMLVNPAPAP